MVKIVVGSKNPAKIDAVKEAFAHYFKDTDVQGIEVPSKVPAQPFGEDIFRGAENRAHAVYSLVKEDDAFCVGIEAGITQQHSRWFNFNCVCILYRGKTGFGTSPYFEIPASLLPQLRQGEELGHLFDAIAGTENIKQKGGAVGYLTKGIIDRKQLQIPAIVMALIPLLNEKLYSYQREIIKEKSPSDIKFTSVNPASAMHLRPPFREGI